MAAPENGRSVTCTDERNFGSACTFDCLTGFSLVGTATLTCGGDGVYDAGAPTCEGKISLHVFNKNYNEQFFKFQSDGKADAYE